MVAPNGHGVGAATSGTVSTGGFQCYANDLIVVITGNPGATPTDSQNNTYAAVTSTGNTIWWAIASATSASLVVSCTTTAPGTAIVAMSFTGFKGSGSGGGYGVPGQVASPASGSLIIGGGQPSGSPTINFPVTITLNVAQGTTYSDAFTYNSGADELEAMGTYGTSVASGSAISCTGTFVGSASSFNAAVAFFPAASVPVSGSEGISESASLSLSYIVQNVVTVAASVAGSTSMSFPATLVPASCSVYVCVASSAQPVQGISDSVGSTYNFIASVKSGAGQWLSWFYADNLTASAMNIITVTSAAPQDMAGNAKVLTGVKAAPSLDAVGAGSTGNSATPNASVTTTLVGDALLMGVVAASAPTWSAGTNNTLIGQAQTPDLSLSTAVLEARAGAAGSYTMNATASGASKGAAMVVAIAAAASPQTLHVGAARTPIAGPAPLTVSFGAQGYGGTPPYTYAWVFGDGGTSALQNPVHTFLLSGAYVNRVTVTDSLSNTASVFLAVTVSISDVGVRHQRVRPSTGASASSRRVRAGP